MISLYTSDRRQTFIVSEMDTSHLMNVIEHHQKQIMALRALPESWRFIKIVDVLSEVILFLADELATRTLTMEDYIREEED